VRNFPVLDFDELDRKVGKKFADIRAASPELADKMLIKALRALYWLGVKQARDELDWCQTCQGRGYYETDGLPLGVCAPPVRELKKQFCGCKRGKELKEIYGKLGDWNRPHVTPRSGERGRQGIRGNAEDTNTMGARCTRGSSVIFNPRPMTEEERRELMQPPADKYAVAWLEIPAFLRRQSNTPST
jgi:hypothetical protein